MGHPGVLRATGWRVVHVLAKDWYDDAAAVTERVARAVADDDPGHGARIAAAVRQELDQAAAEAPAPPVAAGWGEAAGPTPSGGPPVAPAGPREEAATPVETEVGEDSLTGMSVCFTGGSVCSIRGVRLSRDDQERLATQAGLDVRQSVSSRLDILVLANPDSRSTKAERAERLGVRRIAEPAFWRMAGVEVDEFGGPRT